jgi:hypothetical protein
MRMRVQVTANPQVLRRYGKLLDERLDAAVRTTAFKVEGDAKQNAPVDTGALKASIYTVTSKGNLFKAAQDKSAEQAAFGGREHFAFDVLGRQAKIKEAYVVAGAAYAYWVEHGHPSKPFFMARAARANEQFMNQQVKAAIKSVRL